MAQALGLRRPPRSCVDPVLRCASRAARWLAVQPAWLWFAAIMAFGLFLRAVAYTSAYPLHRDEALYGTWARMIADGSDPLLLTAWVDKPPLVLYLLAASLRIFGPSDPALRLPGMLASALMLPTAFALARRSGAGTRGALLAVAFVAVSPYTILFGPTAFTDTWLGLWLAVAAWAALARRPVLAGLCLGLAVASKQTGLLGVPLVIMLLLAAHHDPSASLCTRHPSRSPAPHLRCAAGAGVTFHVSRLTFDVSRITSYAFSLLGFAAIFGLVYWWDTLRWAKRPSFWQRSLDTYGGLYLAEPGTWPERVARWVDQAGRLFGSPVTTAAVVLLAIAAGYAAWRGRQRAALALSVFVVFYLAIHFFVTFQPWDRYLLPLVPLLAVLAARGSAIVWRNLARRAPTELDRGLALAGLALILGVAAWMGSSGRVPVGSDHSAYAGQDQVAAALRTLPPQSKIYHHSLGWQLDWYLYGGGQKPVWWADAAILAQDVAYRAVDEGNRPQWLVIAWATDAPVAQEARAALRARGLSLVEWRRVYRADGTPSFTIFAILPGREVAAPGETA